MHGFTDDIIRAVKEGDASKMHDLIRTQGVSPDTCDASGWSLLHYAILYRQRPLSYELVKLGANVEAQNHDGKRPLHFAADEGQIAISRLLLEKGASCDPGDNDGVTPLHLAAKNGHEDMVALLIEKGAKPGTAKTSSGRKPLHAAACMGHLKIVGLLLAAGADIDARDGHGWTGLHWAVMRKENTPEMVRLLLAQGADPTLQDSLMGRMASELCQNEEIKAILAEAERTWDDPERRAREHAKMIRRLARKGRVPKGPSL